ncbi:DUF6233 domain-containing protein [Streptomyces sp. NPDC055105]|uniref:DUF6233 domain-containing protein n=1 Tax=Streptomyces sp. NPDC055105 TaxID=3365719 RepID=UPI0037CCCB05
MSDLPPSERLAKLAALEEWLEWQLMDTRRRKREAEQAVEEDRRRRERAHAELNFKIEPQRAGRDAKLHRGGCNLYKNQMGFIGRDDALIALEIDDPPIEPCAICNPRSALGLPAS